MVAGALLLGAGVAHADTEEAPLDPLDPLRIVTPLTIVQGNGVKIGDGTALYPEVGVEMGYESNTFYDANNPIGAGVARLMVQLGLGSLSPQRLHPTSSDESMEDVNYGSLIYNAQAYASYDQYISDNSDVTKQGGLGLGFHGRMTANPQGDVSFTAQEGFDRVLRPLNFESRTNANRDLNYGMLRLDIHPASRRLSGSLAYVNQIDIFEQTLGYPDRLHNTLIGRLNYQFFPLSAAYLQVSGGYYTGIDGANKVDSYPLIALLGVTTALGVNTSLLAQAGYTQGFYQAGPDFQTMTATVYFEYRYSPISALRLKYMYDHQDSINANFYRDHAFAGWLEHKFTPFAVYLSPEVRLREYEGVTGMTGAGATRDDVILAAAVGARYQYRAWMTGSLEYRVVDDATDYKFMTTGGTVDPSYVRHEVYAGVRLAY